MNRAVIVVIVGLGLIATSAQARRVVHMPTISELCPGNAEWDKVAQCIGRATGQQLELVRDEAKVKLVHIPAMQRFSGVYVYTHGSRWTIRGELRLTQNHEILGFSPITLGPHTGYRVDIGTVEAFTFAQDEEAAKNAVLRRQFAFVCFDERMGCTEVMTACDVLVHGKAYYSFRGKLAYKDKQLQLVGDRTLAGPYCEQPELVFGD